MRIAVVTGASSGMGREMAIQIGDRFAGIDEIWVIARREKRLKELCGRIPAKIRCFAADVTKQEERERIREALEAEKPRVKILVNAAGAGVMGKIGALSPETENGMIRLNCEALCAVTRIVLPYMEENGRIIQFASAAAFLPQPGFGVYAATKAFVLSYSRALGEELRDRRIYVTAVCPGPVKTEFFKAVKDFGKIPIYKHLVMAKPEYVVRQALRDSMAGRSVSVYGFVMKLFHVFTKIVPHEWILRAMSGIQRMENRTK